jgi:hypothetical protein
VASQKTVQTRLEQIASRMHDLESERAHLLSIYRANRRETIRKTGQVPPLGNFLSPQERTAIEMSESIAASNAEIDRKASLISRA